MYRNDATSCDRHLAKNMRKVLGKSESKNVKVTRNGDVGLCDCGKLGEFMLVADRGR